MTTSNDNISRQQLVIHKIMQMSFMSIKGMEHKIKITDMDNIGDEEGEREITYSLANESKLNSIEKQFYFILFSVLQNIVL